MQSPVFAKIQMVKAMKVVTNTPVQERCVSMQRGGQAKLPRR